MTRLVCLSLALAAALSAPALAQPAPPPQRPPAGGTPATGDSLEEAKVHFAQGVALYNDGNFGAALAEFEASNRLHPSVGLLYNIGLCLKGQFRYAEAIDTLGRYLAEAAALPKALPPEKRAEVEQLIGEMKALLVEVQLEIVPDGAHVVIDARTVGTAPLDNQKLAVGHHVIEVTADGWKPARKELTLAAGMPPLLLKMALQAYPKTGKVHIFAHEGTPQLKIDGRVIGPAPMDIELPAGGHTLEASSPGFTTSVTELVVSAGQERTVPVVLERPKRSFYQKWWFWTLTVGVVALAGLGVGLGFYFGSGTETPLMGTLGTGKVN